MAATIAIIGAGPSALAAAHVLRDAGQQVILYEQNSGPGGRATTRSRAGFTYDHGAQYIKGESPRTNTLLTERFRSPDLLDIVRPVWVFDQDGSIQEGDSLQNAAPKWTYRSGLATLANLLAADLDLRLQTRVDAIAHSATAGWSLFDQAHQPLAANPAQALLITLPAPQAHALIAVSQLPPDLRSALLTGLEVATYLPLLSIMLGYTTAPRERPYYALVNSDKGHPISWLAWEHAKSPERVPPGAGLLIAQMAPGYSQEHWEQPDAEIFNDVARHVSTLLTEPLSTPSFTDIQRWRYALPSRQAKAKALNTLSLPLRLAFCGDSYTGGRVHLAIEHGQDVAHQLLTSLSASS